MAGFPVTGRSLGERPSTKSSTVNALLKANNLSDVASAATSLANLGGAPLASPAFTGTPTAPTPVAADNSTKLATTAFVAGAVPVSSVFTRTGAVVAASGDYTAAQVTNAADKSSGSQQNFTGEIKTPDLVIAGLTGATAASRYVGATTSGAPTSGTFAKGDFVIDQTAAVWVCTVAGSPGTWVNAAAASGNVTAHVASGGQTINSSAQTAVTGFSFTIGASETWTFEINMFITNGSLSSGAVFQVTGPASPSVVELDYFGNSSSTTAFAFSHVTAFSSSSAAFVTAASGTGIVRLTGCVINGANAGTVALTAAGSGGTPSILIAGGSYMVARKSS